MARTPLFRFVVDVYVYSMMYSKQIKANGIRAYDST